MVLRVDNVEISELLADVDLDRPVGMLNLIRFRSEARYAPEDKATPCTGEEAYRRYGEANLPLLTALGAKLVLTAMRELIGPDDEWDMSFVVYYPSGHAFMALIEDPAYLALVYHRVAAVEDSRLTMMQFSDDSVTEALRAGRRG